MSSNDQTAPIASMSLESMSITDNQKAKLKELFPEVFTEGSKIDFDKLKRTLGETVDAGKERFGMNWAGKADCFKTIQQPSVATLVPARDESVDFDTTENVFIEGDNLEVLKLLQKSYLGKIKMIYIDPPYNTGNDFIYPDNYSENLDTYLEYTGQIDGEGRKFSTNVDTDGRFHSKWMNMMYPRLFLAKNLLKDDGVIFISIDDSEVHNLRALCNEVFGAENFIANVIWEKKYTVANDAKYFSDNHDHILVFAKNITSFDIGRLPRTDEMNSAYKNPDNHPKGVWKSTPLHAKSGSDKAEKFEFTFKNGVIWSPPTGTYPRFSLQTLKDLDANDEIWFGNDTSATPSKKTFLIELKNEGIVPRTILSYKEAGHNHESKEEVKALFEENIFDTPKPTKLLKVLTTIGNVQSSDIVLDFFAGSATTAHAIMDLNKVDGINRKYICVQLPEPTDEKSEAFKAGYQTIAEISIERIRRSAKKVENELRSNIENCEQLIVLREEMLEKLMSKPADLARAKAEEEQHQDIAKYREKIATTQVILEKIDLGCSVFKLQQSNFKVWDANVNKTSEAIQLALDSHIDHINPNASQEDILFELLLKAGFQLTTPIEKLTFAGKTVFSIADNALLICLEKELTLDVLKAMAELEPPRVIVLDEGFQNNDQLKTNAALTMKSKGINDFRTV